MEKVINKIINNSIVKSCTYSHNGNTWIVFPEKKQWIISCSNDNGYLWYNYDFFSNLFLYLGLELGDNNVYIKNWVESTLRLKVGEHYHPDFLPSQEGFVTPEYDWRNQFDVEEVINNGVKL